MKILITAPSLDVNNNISGISAVTNIIINNNKSVSYLHLLAGRKDNELKQFSRIGEIFNGNAHLKKLIKDNSFDVFHLNLPLNTKSIYRDFIAYLTCKNAGKKTFVHLHGGKYLFVKPKNPLTRTLIKYILNTADILVVLSELEKQTILKLYGAKNVYVLPNTIEDTFFNVQRQLKEDKTIDFLFLGRLHESKGLHNVLEAFNLLCNEQKNAILTICGKGPLEELVISSAKNNNNIRFLGIAGGQQKLDVLSKCDVFLLPSIYGEGLPIALLEAMASGLVPIVTDDGSMKYVVNDHNGILVEKAQTMDLLQKMREIIGDKNRLQHLSNNARDYIAQNFSIETYIANLNSLYKKTEK